MDDRALQDVYRYRRVSEHMATGGQPTEAQLAQVAEAGCTTVINLGLHDADYALPDERNTVESLGMVYVHIPVIWEQPTRADLSRFSEVMQAHENEDLWIHCAANVRVTVFVALDRVVRLGWPAHHAREAVRTLSLPQVWQAFIDETLHAQEAGPGDAGMDAPGEPAADA
jgi:protein tyrosine phosphatase (PTP) superfamily phosphohydrolase (DUF442 family)